MARSIPQNQPRLGASRTYHEVVDSTQDEARRLAAEGAPHGHLVWAGAQTAGRGRMDRTWHSSVGCGLWFSVVVRPSQPLAAMAALPLVTGVAVAEALSIIVPGNVALKWPNDVLIQGRKVAGVLVEGHAAAGTLEHAVLGVGVNLRRPPGGFPAEIASTAVALEEVGPAPEAADLLDRILEQLDEGYAELLVNGPAAVRRRWLTLSDTIGREVVAHSDAEDVSGVAVDLDPVGNLVLQTPGGPRVISFGEIRHLR